MSDGMRDYQRAALGKYSQLPGRATRAKAGSGKAEAIKAAGRMLDAVARERQVGVLGESVMDAARRRVAEFDRIDGTPITAAPPDEALRTVMSAIAAAHSGYSRGDKDGEWCLAEALAMLEQLEFAQRGKAGDPYRPLG